MTGFDIGHYRERTLEMFNDYAGFVSRPLFRVGQDGLEFPRLLPQLCK